MGGSPKIDFIVLTLGGRRRTPRFARRDGRRGPSLHERMPSFARRTADGGCPHMVLAESWRL